MSSADRPPTMPYPGLRPFEAEDHLLFFGREAQVSAMLRQLEDDRFVAVVGSSGSGKSSLVRAGLLPALREGFLLGTTDWLTLVIKPGQQPYQNLARALTHANRTSGETQILPTLRSTDRGLLVALRELGISPDSTVLLVVDQFEELFAFRRATANRDAVASRDEAAAFVSLLLRSCSEPAGRLWVVLTMRSDFIGDCEAFLGLPQAVSRSQFLVPRLDRGQMEEAIARPGAVREAAYQPFTFEEGLVNRIINDAGDRPDQLPLMQHALMRTWKLAVQRSSKDGASVRMMHADYNAAGEIEHALSLDADRAWNNVRSDPRKARVARHLFLLLCDISPDGQMTRRHPRVDEIQAATGATLEEIAEVVRAFQEDDRNFLLPPIEQGLAPDTPLDLSHEALLRRWQLFATEWLEEERRDASELRRVAELASLHNQNQGGLLQAQDLERITHWRDRVSAEWARRYVPNERWAEVVAFIDASTREHDAQIAATARARERALRRARTWAWAYGAIALVLIAWIFGYRYLYVWESTAYYVDFVKVYGAPKGIRSLTAEQVQHRPWSIKVVRNGLWGVVARMHAINSRGEPTGRHSIGTYVTASQQAQREVRWDFVYGADGRVAYEIASDESGARLWTLIYSPALQLKGRPRVAHFVGPDGYPRPMQGYGNAFVRIEYSPEGYEALITYRNAMGKPRPGIDKAFGRRQKYDASGRLIETVSVDPKGQPMVDEAGNAGTTVTYDGLGNSIEQRATDASGAVTTMKDGWSRARATYDSSGNLTGQAFFDESGRPAQVKDGYHRWSQRLDNRGRSEEVLYWDPQGKPALTVDGCHGQRIAYDEHDNAVEITCLGTLGKPAPNNEGVTTTNLKYDERDNVIETAYADEAGRAVSSSKGYSRTTSHFDERGNSIETTYFGADGKRVPTERGYSRTKSEYDDRDNEIGRSYFGTDDRPLVIVEDTDTSCARWERRYDGNVGFISQAYFGVDGKPMAGPDGIASWQNTYDGSGNRIEAAYFGTHGERVRSGDGYAGWRSTYDALGRQAAIEYLDIDDTPLASPEGVAGWKSQFDAQGNETERRFYGVDDQLVSDTSESAGWHAQYDRRGNQTDIRYFDTNGNPKLRLWDPKSPRKGGYARMSRQFDTRNRIVEEEYFGVRGERIGGPEGWARIVKRYGLVGTEAVETAYFGVDNEPFVLAEGYHAVKRKLDQYGRVIEETYFDRDGRAVNTSAGFAKLQKRYDVYGRQTEEAIFGPDDSPISDGNGKHKWVKRFDERGRVVEQRWFGVRDEPVQVGGNGQHSTRYVYDDRGNTIEVAHFDIQGNAALGPDPTDTLLCARWRGKYDAVGKVVSTMCDPVPPPKRQQNTISPTRGRPTASSSRRSTPRKRSP